HLHWLVSHGQLASEGEGRARRYRSLKQLETRDRSSDLKVSKEGEIIRKAVRAPLQQRNPVGYDRTFLERYKPNDTFYLSDTLRKHLARTGTSSTEPMPAGTYARNILDRLLIDLSWNSSRLEGNTYSLLETKRLIELGETATGKDASEAQMILNHKAAIEYIVESVQDDGITSHEIYSVHALLSQNLLGDPGASGRARTIRVGVAGTTYIPLENPQVIKECFDLFVEKAGSIADPF